MQDREDKAKKETDEREKVYMFLIVFQLFNMVQLQALC
jgi:hypothetical protein